MVCLSGVQPFFSGRVDQTRDSGGNRTYTYAKSFPVSNGRIYTREELSVRRIIRVIRQTDNSAESKYKSEDEF